MNLMYSKTILHKTVPFYKLWRILQTLYAEKGKISNLMSPVVLYL